MLFEPPMLIILIPNSPPSQPLWFGFQPVDVSPIRPSHNAAYPVSSPRYRQIGMNVRLIMDSLALLKL